MSGRRGASIEELTSGRLLARNAAINLLGQVAPMVVAIVAIPLLIQGLGTDRFGVLTLMWVVIGYFSLLDLGLGRAVTHLVAERLGRGREQEVPGIAWTALALVLAFGGAGGAVAAALTPWLVLEVAHLPVALESETVRSMYLLALSLPAVTSTAALRGILEAAQRFDLVNLLRLPLSVFNYAGPLLVLPFSSSLVPVIALLLIGRIIAWIAHMWLCLRTLPALRRIGFDRRSLRALVGFGGWATLSNVVSPVMVYLDRFLIGGMVSVTAVAFYVTPYEVVTKLWVVPAGLLGVLYPAIAAAHAHERARTLRLFWSAFRAMLLIVFPITLIIVTFAPEGLDVWLGPAFAANSSAVLRWLATGIFVNCLGQVAYTVLQGVGRPDLTGKLHLAELPPYLVLLWLLVSRFGIEGAAAAWVIRTVIDSLALFVLADRFLVTGESLLARILPLLSGMVMVLCTALLLKGAPAKLAFVGVVLGAFFVLVWRRLLEEEDRAALQGLLRGVRQSATTP